MYFNIRGKLLIMYFAVVKLLEKKWEHSEVVRLLTSSKRMTQLRGKVV